MAAVHRAVHAVIFSEQGFPVQKIYVFPALFCVFICFAHNFPASRRSRVKFKIRPCHEQYGRVRMACAECFVQGAVRSPQVACVGRVVVIVVHEQAAVERGKVIGDRLFSLCVAAESEIDIVGIRPSGNIGRVTVIGAGCAGALRDGRAVIKDRRTFCIFFSAFTSAFAFNPTVSPVTSL